MNPESQPKNTVFFQSLANLYRQVDAEIASHSPHCEASGRCCRFKEYGHTLFLSEGEAEYLLANAPAWTGPVSEAFCPFQVNGLCTAREPRPLGCRVYFCDPAFQDVMPTITERWLSELKSRTTEQGKAWRYAPLHVFLREAWDKLQTEGPIHLGDQSQSPGKSFRTVSLPTITAPTQPEQ